MKWMRTIVFLFAAVHGIHACEPLVIDSPGQYEIRFVENTLALVNIDEDERAVFNLQAAISSGGFQLAADITNQFIIAADNVSMDLGNHTVRGGIVIAPNKQEVKICNGLIGGKFASSLAAGVNIRTGCKEVSLLNLSISNATVGINSVGAVGGVVKNCTMSQNTTGVLLQQSHKFTFVDSQAVRNTSAGFSLVSSTTTCFRDCKAISTGEGNTNLEADIIGFSAINGNGNIFERCIANSTQGLTVTGFSSVVAGFALRGNESCTKIIDSESANATTSVEGVTIPYGILLEGQLDPNLTLTAVPFIPEPPTAVAETRWSPDGKFFAVGDTASPFALRIYEFDRENFTMTQIATDESATDDVRAISWSPDGAFIVTGTLSTNPIRVYTWDAKLKKLELVNTFGSFGQINTGLAWDPTGRFIVVAEQTGQQVSVLSFDRITFEVTLVDSLSFSTQILASVWNPDGKFIAIIERTSTPALTILRFENNTLTETDSTTIGNQARDCVWSFDGKYIATAGTTATKAAIYQFNSDGTVSLLVTANPTGTPESVEWSPDGKFVAYGSTSGSLPRLEVFLFDRGSNTLTLVASSAETLSININEIHWSPDGGFISAEDKVFQALTFPSKNVITNNTVYCNSGNSCPGGIGISGSSICNLIIGNTAYSNPIPTGTEGGGPIVPTNYAFVTNIFNQLFGDAPTGLQNISLNVNEPITIPPDNVLTAKQILSKLCGIFSDSTVDILQSTIETLITDVGCSPTPVTGPTTLSSGVYCLNNDVSGAIVIDDSDVVLDLSTRRVTGGIQVTANNDQITIRNGVIANAGSDALKVNSGVTNIILEDLLARDSQIGINLEEVTGGFVRNCEFTQNTTGLELDKSHNIVVDSCIARTNINAGFCLLSSTTNCLRDCKALSTGKGNTQAANQTIFGFVATDGTGNIFERCIANSTQALSTVDFASLVAGFALRGSENCSKIIDSESANATTNVEGVTIPYGILLEGSINSPITLTAVPPIPIPGSASDAMAISPDDKYVAVGADDGTLRVYEFDHSQFILTQIAIIDFGSNININGIDWHPNGRFLAVGNQTSSTAVRIYEFNRINNTLDPVDLVSFGTTSVNGLSWSHDGRFIGIAAATGIFRVYKFDLLTQSLTLIDNAALGGSVQVRSVGWRQNNKHIAVGSNAAGAQIQVYSFENDTLTLIDSTSPGFQVQGTVWSFDGKFLATGAFASNQPIGVYSFENNILNLEASAAASGNNTGIVWSPDGKFVARVAFDANGVFVYEFDRGTSTLNQVAVSSPAERGAVLIWSHDGSFILSACSNVTNNRVCVYEALTFPSKNVVTNNTVYCNSGNSCPGGIGISGSSICNYIVGNTAYSNPLNPPIVGTNYTFVTNVFDQNFQNTPTLLQNISLNCNQPICTPDDEGLLAKQLLAKVANLEACEPTPLSSLNISGGTISITESGNYCLAEDVTADIAITVTCAMLDLNDRCVTGEIDVSTSIDVLVQNGFVKPPAGATPAAVNIASTALRTMISKIFINCTASTGATAGRVGINNAGNDTQILGCTIIAGNAGTTAAGGDGINCASDSTRALIQDCVIISGDGGSTSGDGGHGIHVESDARNTKIMNCIIFATGSAVSGAGGNGVKIESGAVDTELRMCTIRNTGSGSTSSGKAVDDDVAAGANESIVFSNFAHNIANAIKFDLQAGGVETGVAISNPPGATVVNPLANVYAS